MKEGIRNGTKREETYSLTKLWNSLIAHVRLSSDANDFRAGLFKARLI